MGVVIDQLGVNPPQQIEHCSAIPFSWEPSVWFRVRCGVTIQILGWGAGHVKLNLGIFIKNVQYHHHHHHHHHHKYFFKVA